MSPRLISCRDCGNPCSRSAVRCPACGAKLRFNQFEQAVLYFLLVPLAFVVGFGVLVVVYGLLQGAGIAPIQ